LVQGYANFLSSDSYNYDLSIKRANKIKDELIAQGLNQDYIGVVGFGEKSPLYDNYTEDGLKNNRRVEVEVFIDIDDLKIKVGK